MRIGIGYDVHKLVEDRNLIIGGEHIPYKKGLLGHSDADVLIHAIIDALLGSAALGDIGKHFPDSDNKYKGFPSLKFLELVSELLNDNNYEIVNIDSIIIAEKPKMSPHIDKMRANIAKSLKIKIEQVGIKATTTEKLGFCGKGEGIASQAVALIKVKE